MDGEEGRPVRENPKQFLLRMQGRGVSVELKWGQTYEGRLVCADNYFNILLEECCEVENGMRTELGEVSIRCNNIKSIWEASVCDAG